MASEQTRRLTSSIEKMAADMALKMGKAVRMEEDGTAVGDAADFVRYTKIDAAALCVSLKKALEMVAPMAGTLRASPAFKDPCIVVDTRLTIPKVVNVQQFVCESLHCDDSQTSNFAKLQAVRQIVSNAMEHGELAMGIPGSEKLITGDVLVALYDCLCTGPRYFLETPLKDYFMYASLRKHMMDIMPLVEAMMALMVPGIGETEAYDPECISRLPDASARVAAPGALKKRKFTSQLPAKVVTPVNEDVNADGSVWEDQIEHGAAAIRRILADIDFILDNKKARSSFITPPGKYLVIDDTRIFLDMTGVLKTLGCMDDRFAAELEKFARSVGVSWVERGLVVPAKARCKKGRRQGNLEDEDAWGFVVGTLPERDAIPKSKGALEWSWSVDALRALGATLMEELKFCEEPSRFSVADFYRAYAGLTLTTTAEDRERRFFLEGHEGLRAIFAEYFPAGFGGIEHATRVLCFRVLRHPELYKAFDVPRVREHADALVRQAADPARPAVIREIMRDLDLAEDTDDVYDAYRCPRGVYYPIRGGNSEDSENSDAGYDSDVPEEESAEAE